MIAKTKTKSRSLHARHKYGKHYLKVYWPYLPFMLALLVVLTLGSLFSSSLKGIKGYATNTTVAGLLDATNQRRAENSQKTLSLQDKLNRAAQDKANDMAARNYWSHNTPEGDPPWLFIDRTGYKYSKAGENLAYGFNTSGDTVAGWMNSQSHRDNLLDSAFLDVGFGIANVENYQDSGQQTVVVAMYGQVLGASASESKPAEPTPAKKPASAPNPVTPEPAPSPEPPPAQPVTSDTAVVTEPAPQTIARVQALTAGRLPWLGYLSGFGSGSLVAVFLLRHWLALRHLFKTGRNWVLHHPLLDIAIIILFTLSFMLSKDVGVIR